MSAISASLDRLLSRARFVDLSPQICSHMHRWPAHPDVNIIADARNHDQHGYYLQMLVMPEHSGSHVDAPAHVHRHLMDRTIDTYAVDRLLKPGKKVDARALDLQPGQTLSLAQYTRLAEEQGITITPGDIALVQFGWDIYLTDPEHNPQGVGSWWGGNAPGFTEELCAWFAEQKVTAVGTDTAGCDIAVVDGKILSAFGHDTYFLPRDILILEGLYGLDQLPGEFYFMALPLKIKNGSGSPLRAIAVVDGENL